MPLQLMRRPVTVCLTSDEVRVLHEGQVLATLQDHDLRLERLKKLSQREELTNQYRKALADRERDVLDLMAQGLSNTAIAERMSLSTRTVESHVRSIMTKMDLWEDPAGNRRVQAVIRWLDQH